SIEILAGAHSPDETGDSGLPAAPPRPKSTPNDHPQKPAPTVPDPGEPPPLISNNRNRSRDPCSSHSRPPRSLSDDIPRRPAATVLSRNEAMHCISIDRERSHDPCRSRPRPPKSVFGDIRYKDPAIVLGPPTPPRS